MIWGSTGRRAIAAVGCVAALAVAGCGSSNSSSTTSSSTTASTSSAQTSTTNTATLGIATAGTASYLKQLAGVIGPWQRAAVAFEGNFQRAVAAKSKQLIASTLDTFTSANDTFATKLSNLQAPANAQARQDDLVSKVRQLGADLEDAKAAFEQTDASALQSIDAKIKSDTQALVQSAAALGQAVHSAA